MPSEKRQPVYFFQDESSTSDSVVGIGGLAVPKDRLGTLNHEIIGIKDKLKFQGEVKWSNNTSRYDNPHLEFIQYLYDKLASGDVHLHLLFAPLKYRSKKSKQATRNDRIGKLHDTMLVYRALRYYGRDHPLNIRLDNGSCTEKNAEFKQSMIERCEKKFGGSIVDLRSIETRDSANEPMLQLLDVTLGALTRIRNGRSNTKKGKVEAISLAKKLYGPDFVFIDTNKETTKPKTVWNFRPS